MRCLVLGATGLVGQAFIKAGAARGHEMTAAARRGAALSIDAADDDALLRAIDELRPDAVINCTSYGSLDDCARDPSAAYRVNARLNARLAELCRAADALLVAIGTDHYFTGDGAATHDELAEVRLLNDYAVGKYAGERLALTWRRCLAVRTNVTGFRRWSGQPTFVEWVCESLRTGAAIELFDDYYCSTIDSGSLALAVIEMTERGVTGLFNVACREVASKRRFVLALADRLALPTHRLRTGSVRSLAVPRAESAGLDVAKAEAALGRLLPGFDEVIGTLADEARTEAGRA